MEFPTIPGVLCGLRFFDDIREVKPITAKHAKKGSKRTQRTVSSNYGTHGHSGRHTKGRCRMGI
jgi:hypothetical protein